MFDAKQPNTMRLVFFGALMLVAGAALAFTGGPPDARTNAPGETTCTDCHGTFPLNSGSGMLALTGLPERYIPGETYDLSLTLSDPDAARWGFELTILEDGGSSTGAITVTDDGTQTSTTGDRDYLKHNVFGVYPGTTGSASWVFQWTAPAEGTGAVNLYAVGNAANNDFLMTDDRIYATSFGAEEDTSVPVLDLPHAMTLHGAAPNPFNPRTEIRFDLPRTSHVRVTVLTIDGRRIDTLADGTLGEGAHAVDWDGRSHDGARMSSGAYLFVVEAGGDRQVGRMTMLK